MVIEENEKKENSSSATLWVGQRTEMKTTAAGPVCCALKTRVTTGTKPYRPASSYPVSLFCLVLHCILVNKHVLTAVLGFPYTETLLSLLRGGSAKI